MKKSLRSLLRPVTPSKAPPRQPEWHHILCFFKDIQATAIGMPLAEHLLANGCGLAYYARYTNKPGYRLELKVYSALSKPALKKLIITFLRLTPLLPRLSLRCSRIAFDLHKHPLATKPTPGCFTGSRPHALALHVVKALLEENKLQDMTHLLDVFHWMANMAGFSYLQESEASLRHAHMGLANSVAGSWKTGPVFPIPTTP